MPPVPTFNLLPVSKGFRVALAARLEKIQQILPTASEEAVEADLEVTVEDIGSGSTLSTSDEIPPLAESAATLAVAEAEPGNEEEPEPVAALD